MSDEIYKLNKPMPFERVRNRVEAFQIKEETLKEVAAWCGGEVLTYGDEEPRGYIRPTTSEPVLKVPNVDGPLTAQYTEWVIKTEDGRFKVVPNKDFAKEFLYIKEQPTLNIPEGVR